ncbi:MAG: tetratricopeptide repeat protein [Burkholderiales bacterium]
MKNDELSKALALLRRGDWEAAHRIVQRDEESPLACWAHGIVHLMEGDTSNARYWYREAKREFPGHPSIADEIDALDKALDS